MFMQGGLDSDGALQSRFNFRWGPSLVTKVMAALVRGGENDMVQVEHEYTGDDFTASLKMINPSYLEGGLTGTLIGSHFQSVTPKLSLGMETVWQRSSMLEGPQTMTSYVGRYKTDDWIAHAQIMAQGTLSASYWRKLSDKVQAGTELNLSLLPSQSLMGGIQKQGLATVGARYQFRISSVKAQIDSRGKLSVILEKQVNPMSPIMMSFAVEAEPSTVSLSIFIPLCCFLSANTMSASFSPRPSSESVSPSKLVARNYTNSRRLSVDKAL